MALFQLHVPILDDIKAKGLKSALLGKLNDVVTRVTVGMDIAEVRAVLRGDPPGRPNPRLKPHADGFWFHMRPTYYHNLVTPLYPSFRLGWFSAYFFVLETITGLFLMIFYTPSPQVAYRNMLNIMSNVPFGLLMRDLHRIGAEGMVIAVGLHMLRTFLTGNYKKPRQFTWFSGAVLLWVTLFLSFSGYLLPWDQLSLWAVTIGASMAEASPTPWPLNLLGERFLADPQFIGTNVNLLLRGAPQIGEGGLLRFYLLHVFALPLVVVVALGVHYYKVVIHGHSLPPEAEAVGEDTAKRVPMDQRTYFTPDIITRELFYLSAITFILVAWVALPIPQIQLGPIKIPFHAPLEPHADPQVTPLHTTAPWYFLWLQGMLKLGDKVLWGVLLPTAIVGLTLVLPYLEVGPSRRYGHRRIGLSAGLIVVALLAILSFMGTPHYAVTSSPDQEVAAVLAPETHPGPLRTTHYDDLLLGEYSAGAWASAPTVGLQKLLGTYAEALEREAIRKDPARYGDAKGYLIVEQWQENLKKITIRVTWNGGQNTFEKRVYLHRDSGYGD